MWTAYIREPSFQHSASKLSLSHLCQCGKWPLNNVGSFSTHNLSKKCPNTSNKSIFHLSSKFTWIFGATIKSKLIRFTWILMGFCNAITACFGIFIKKSINNQLKYLAVFILLFTQLTQLPLSFSWILMFTIFILYLY